MEISRYLEPPVRDDLAQKMVFLAGPRQVGKTTLARRVLAAQGSGAYLNWDNREDRREIRQARWPAGEALLVLDELHKWREWKSWIKGEFDKHRDHLRFLVTGSARMDVYRKGGDSLQGRYHHYRLHPFTYAEMAGQGTLAAMKPFAPLPIPERGEKGTVRVLMAYGGFPEPCLAQSQRTLRRWQKERLERFFREDVRDLESVRDIGSMQLLADLVPGTVGAPLSLNALREDLEVSHRAVHLWMDILERLYFIFRVPPFASKPINSLKKMTKTYLWDPTLVIDTGARYENMIALHLLKYCHLLQDREGYKAELFHLRDRAGHEVDFLVCVDRNPWFAAEAKAGQTSSSPHLAYFRDRLKIPYSFHVVLESEKDYLKDGIRSLPAWKFLGALV
jgi:hypothetical protein